MKLLILTLISILLSASIMAGEDKANSSMSDCTHAREKKGEIRDGDNKDEKPETATAKK